MLSTGEYGYTGGFTLLLKLSANVKLFQNEKVKEKRGILAQSN